MNISVKTRNMPVSYQDFVLYSRATGAPLPRTPQERMQMTPQVYNFTRQIGGRPSGIRQGLSAVGRGLAVLGGAGVAVGVANSLFNKPSDNYRQSVTDNQTIDEKESRDYDLGVFDDSYTTGSENYTGQAPKKSSAPVSKSTVPSSQSKGVVETDADADFLAQASNRRSNVNPDNLSNEQINEAYARITDPQDPNTVEKLAKEKASQNPLIRKAEKLTKGITLPEGRLIQEASEPFDELTGSRESKAVSSIRMLPEGGVGIQFQPKKRKDGTYGSNIQYDYPVTAALSQQDPDLRETFKGIKMYSTKSGQKPSKGISDFYEVGYESGQMGPREQAAIEQMRLADRLREVEFEDNEKGIRDMVASGKINTEGAPRATDFVKAFTDKLGYSNLVTGGSTPPDQVSVREELVQTPPNKKLTEKKNPEVSDLGERREDNASVGIKAIAAAGGDLAREALMQTPEDERLEAILNDPALKGMGKGDNPKANPLATMDRVLSKPLSDNPIAGGVQGGIKAGQVMGSVIKRGAQDTGEVLRKAENFLKGEVSKAMRAQEEKENPGFQAAYDAEKEIRAGLSGNLTDEQKREAIRKGMIDKGYGNFLK
mgnify:CR=1 FL=1